MQDPSLSRTGKVELRVPAMYTKLGINWSKIIWHISRNLGLRDTGRVLASRWPFPVRVKVIGGHRMYVDLRSSIGRGLFATGKFDMLAIEPALDALGPGSTFVDIGANIGFYSILAAERVGSAGRVYSFEIDSRPLKAFRKTVRFSGLQMIHIEELAVSDIDGKATFLPAEEHGHNKIEPSSKVGRQIRTARLDTWVKQKAPDRIDVIKIDVEGAEKLVIEGARDTILQYQPIIICEVTDQMEHFGHHVSDLLFLLEKIGYDHSWIDGAHTPAVIAKPRSVAQ